MIFQCYRCGKLYDENDGCIAEIIGFTIMGASMVFICKNCISKKGKKIIEKIQKERKKK